MRFLKRSRKNKGGAPEKRGASFTGRLSVHPLFFLVGILSAFTGGLLQFISACLAAIEHECAHAFVAKRYGFRLDKIVLMPYGAVISGDVSGLSPKEEFFVAIAGPLTNLFTALGFVALWWIYPETYPFTEAAVTVSLSLFFVNLLPAYPLDGGRILGIALRPLFQGRTKAVLKITTLLISAAIFGFFVYSCFVEPNFSALVFSALLCAGAFGGGKYARLKFSHKKSFMRGVEETRIANSASCALKDGLRFLRDDRFIVFVVYDGEEFLGELSEIEFLDALEKYPYTAPLGNCLTEFTKGS